MGKMIFSTKEKVKKNNGIPHKDTWKIIISDDDKSVHQITCLALKDFVFADKGLEFISVYSGEETIKAIKKHPDTAILLQDVVMEQDNTGLEVIKTIRDELKNHFVRIILRTGQPGEAPERDVIINYDINDYKEKTELSSQKLFTLIYSSLRSYRDIIALEHNKAGLQKIIESSASIFIRQSIEQFIKMTLEQLTGFLCEHSSSVSTVSRLAVRKVQHNSLIVAALGEYELHVTQDAQTAMDATLWQLFEQVLKSQYPIQKNGYYAIYLAQQSEAEVVFFFKGDYRLSELDQHLINLYMKQVAVIYENLMLYNQIEQGQQEIINLLGTSIETRSKETGNHVKRVTLMSCILARMIGMDELDIEVLKQASPLHDLGKIGIPDAILNKPAKLTSDEWTIMKTHCVIGHDLLVKSNCKCLQAGAIVSHEHHEKWDGSGYPQGLKGDQIHIYGRITAVADVFDALASERCYKKAWSISDILILFEQQKGMHFEPRLVDLLLDNIDEFIAIQEQYKD